MLKRFHTTIEKVIRLDNTDDGNPMFAIITKDGEFQTALDHQVAHSIHEEMAGRGAVVSTYDGEIINLVIDPNWDTAEVDLILENDEEFHHLARFLELDELQVLITENAEEWGVKASNVDTQYIYNEIHSK